MEQYVNQLLNMSTRIGVLMLQSGAEIYRVEDSVHRIHMAYCAGESQVYCVPTTVIATVSLPGGENATRCVRVTGQKTNLSRMMALSDLCRRICLLKPDFDTVNREIDRILEMPVYTPWQTCLAWALVSMGFTMLFGGGFAEAALSLIPAVLVAMLSCPLARLQVNVYFNLLLESFCIGAVSMSFAFLLPGVHSDSIIIGVLMNLVPGLALTNCIRDVMAGDLTAGVSKLADVLLIAVSIALGAVGASSAVSLLMGVIGLG